MKRCYGFRKDGEENILKFWYDFQVSIYLTFINILKYHKCQFLYLLSHK